MSAALLLSLGILLHDLVPHRPDRFLIADAALALLAATVRQRLINTTCIAAIIVLLGIGIAQREHFEFSRSDIALFATDEPHLTELEFRLIDDPQLVTGPADQRMLPPKQIATAKVLKIKTWNGWVDATGQIPVQIDQPQPALAAGQIVQALGMLQRPRPVMNPGEFDWSAFYRQQRTLAEFTINRTGNVHILADAQFSIIRWLGGKTRHLLAAGFTAQQTNAHALLDAMLLGDRDPPLRDIEDQFQQTGMGYQLSVSGLHIGFLAWIVFWICRVARLRPHFTLAIVTGFVLLYASIALPSHSGIRAAILSIIVTIAMLGNRSTDRSQVLSLAVIAMLLWHPLDLYSAGFHLSFVVVFAFVFLLPALQSRLRSLRNLDDLARPRPMHQSAMREFRDAAVAWISQCAQLAAIAWLATLPLVVYHFGQMSSWSVLGSLVLLPIVLLSLLGGSIKILLTLLWPIAAGKWAVVASWPPRLLLAGVHLLSRLPGSSLTLPVPPVWLIGVYYLLLCAPLLEYRGWLIGRGKWALRLAPLIGVTMIVCVRARPQMIHDQLRVTLLSLGAGQCAVVELPTGNPILIDAGSTTVSDVATKIVEPFLRTQGDTKVDEIFLSHGDFDHISAAGEITAADDVRQVFTSYHFIKNAIGNVPDQVLLDELEKLDRSPKQIAIGDHFDLRAGVMIDVLWPPKTGDLNSNNAGLVLRLTYAGRSILFPADIQDPAFIGVLKNPSALKSDVLVAPHHGSSEELTPAFLAAVQPQIILSSNFGRLTSKQKRFETMIGQTPLYRTPECGAITVTINKDGKIAVTTFVKGANPK